MQQAFEKPKSSRFEPFMVAEGFCNQRSEVIEGFDALLYVAHLCWHLGEAAALFAQAMIGSRSSGLKSKPIAENPGKMEWLCASRYAQFSIFVADLFRPLFDDFSGFVPLRGAVRVPADIVDHFGFRNFDDLARMKRRDGVRLIL